jgi:parallel beta-helix repeat protein
MKNIFISIITIISFILFSLVVNAALNNFQYHNNHNILNQIIYVDDDNINGPWDGSIEHPFRKIKDGIQNSIDGDSIFILDGIYKETFEIRKKLNLIAQNRNKTIIEGDYKKTILKIKVNDVKINNLTIRNSDGSKDSSAIEICSSNVVIDNCLIYRTKSAFFFNKSYNNIVKNCLLNTNSDGILLLSSSNISLTGCEIFHNGFGMNIQNSSNIKINENYFHENGLGIFVNSSSNINISNSAICDNNDNQGGCFIFHSSAIDIYNCNFYHNGVAIDLDNSSNIGIFKSDILLNSHFAIILEHDSNNVLISKCEIIDNFRYGIHITKSNCILKNNNIFNNSIDGIHVAKSFCTATNNYWGKKTGPFFTGFRFVDILNKNFGKIYFYPWLKNPIDKIGSDWNVSDFYNKTVINGYKDNNIVFQQVDNDNDCVPDWWEKKWGYDPNIWDDHKNIDEDDDSLNNLEECYCDKYGSNPFKKDVFLEFDWIKSFDSKNTNKPSLEHIEQMISRFAEHDIYLHVDIGDLGGGEEISHINNFNYDVLKEIYWDFFLNGDIKNPRKNIFHYGLICDYGPGPGFAFIGFAHLNSFCISAQWLVDGNPIYSRDQLIMTGSMHELGHTFGLFADDYGGIDNRATVKPKYWEFWIYLNYKSCMNYLYTWDLLDYSDGLNGQNDFDDWGNLDFNFFKNTSFY